VPGFATALLANVGSGRGLWQMAAAHAAIWTLLPCDLSLDIIEALTSGRKWQAFGQLRVVAAFAAGRAIMRRIAASILITEGVLPSCILGACRIVVLSSLRTGLLVHWACWVVWTKYFVVILGLTLPLFVLTDSHARRSPRRLKRLVDHFKSSGFLCSRSAVMAAADARHRAAVVASPYERNPAAADDYDLRILALLAFGPAITLIAASVLTDRGLITKVGPFRIGVSLGPG
jgi:hypothetical protein